MSRGILLVILLLPAVASSRPAPMSRARAYLAALAAGRFDHAAGRHDPTMKRVMPSAKLKQLWRSLEAQVGAYRREVRAAERAAGKAGARVVVLTSAFARARLEVSITVDARGRIGGLFFRPAPPARMAPPPAYAQRRRFVERPLMVGPLKLPGTLSLPRGAGPKRRVPAAVLVHGSGPHDQDETIGPNKPLRDLAWGLASRGVAVLRYTKRTKVKQLAPGATVEQEVVLDALAAVAALRRQPGVDPGRVFVVGHSLGAVVAPRIGRRDRKIAGLVLLAGNARPLERVVLSQVEYLARLDGKVTAAERERIAETREMVALISGPKLAAQPAARVLMIGLSAAYWRDLAKHDAVKIARAYPKPLLVAQGGRDYQITTADFDLWREALKKRRSLTRFAFYKRANHLFIDGEGKPSPAEYDRPGNVTKKLVVDIAAFINRRP